MVSKPQPRIPEVFVVQYSYFAAEAGVVIAAKANTINAAGAAANFKTCLIFVSLVKSPMKTRWDGGNRRAIALKK